MRKEAAPNLQKIKRKNIMGASSMQPRAMGIFIKLIDQFLQQVSKGKKG